MGKLFPMFQGMKDKAKYDKAYRESLRDEVRLAYAKDGKIECACCGENGAPFLTIDHINNDGAQHREVQGKGLQLLIWLKKNNFPDGFQLLCWNCNCAKGRYGGVCPHKIPELLLSPVKADVKATRMATVVEMQTEDLFPNHEDETPPEEESPA